MPEAAALPVSRDPVVDVLQIDRPPDIVGKYPITGAFIDCQ